MTSFFSAEGGPIWIKFRRLVQNDMSTGVMWSKSKPDVEFQYGVRLGEFNDVIPEPPATLQGVATWRIQCHDSRATCHIAGCCHLANLLSRFQSHAHAALQGVRIPYAILKIVVRHILFIFLFLMQFRL